VVCMKMLRSVRGQNFIPKDFECAIVMWNLIMILWYLSR
jgi:hypothetical protein